MNELRQLEQSLKHRLSLPLPGREVQLQMAHAERKLSFSGFKIPDDAKVGAVLILFYEEDYQVKFPLILRESNLGVHAGQISFPGGKFEEQDKDLSDTALREAEEEISVSRHQVEIIGRLTELYIPPSNFLVHPFVGIAKSAPFFIPQPEEVVAVLPMNLDDLLNDMNVGEKEVTLSSGLKAVTPYFNLSGLTVWGATAMMLSELKTVLQEVTV